MKIAAIGDIHCRTDTCNLVREILGNIEEEADVLILAGDLTDMGRVEEAEVLVSQLLKLKLPIVSILGNHDHEAGNAEAIGEILIDAGIHLLDGTSCIIGEVGFVGTKGFCGGFGDNLVQPFGEAALKTFIRTSIDEVAKFEGELSQVKTQYKIAVLHYSPIVETIVGEPPEIYAFLGTSRLAEAIDRQCADVVVHGHSHHGYLAGRTKGNIPVYNVCRFVQKQYTGKPYHIIEY